MKHMQYGFPIAFALMLCGCDLPQRLSSIGEAPQLSHIQDPTRLKGYQPITMPMPYGQDTIPSGKTPSLWQTGAQAFFKDQRAYKIGDIITVKVHIDQDESIEMTPTINRQNQGIATYNSMFGLEKAAANAFGAASTPNVLNVTSNPQLTGSAKYEVKDKMTFQIAATVVQILPNGNMVVDGRQEMRLVNEVREVMIKGIVRREDISASNTINSEKVSELRISYGGRGDLSDMQSFPWGQQIANKLLPF